MGSSLKKKKKKKKKGRIDQMRDQPKEVNLQRSDSVLDRHAVRFISLRTGRAPRWLSRGHNLRECLNP